MLIRALAIIALVAVPMLLVYAAVPGAGAAGWRSTWTYRAADGALVVLGAAMTLLAVGSLGVQYMLAIERGRASCCARVAAVAEVAILLSDAGQSLVGFATVVLALQARGRRSPCCARRAARTARRSRRPDDARGGAASRAG